jgi:hypothetical protein
MSSKWVQVRDSIVDAMQAEEVGKELKDRFVGWAETEGIDFIQAFADGVIDECRKDAEKESGWCRIRDSVVLPVALTGGVFVLKLVLTKAATAEIK